MAKGVSGKLTCKHGRLNVSEGGGEGRVNQGVSRAWSREYPRRRGEGVKSSVPEGGGGQGSEERRVPEVVAKVGVWSLTTQQQFSILLIPWTYVLSICIFFKRQDGSICHRPPTLLVYVTDTSPLTKAYKG